MLQKFVIGLTLTLLASLIWLVGNFTKISTAKESETITSHEVRSTSPSGASFSPRRQIGETPTPEGTVTVSSNSTIYLPLIMHDYCPNPFSYNESIRYNMEKINVKNIWRCIQGSGIVVAVVDSGVDLDHPDLQANIVTGKTFVSGTSSPDDDNGHGSHVAGVVAGVGNNGGIIGVAPRAKIMPVKVLDYGGSGTTFGAAEGIRWAADHGARIINMSWGGVGYSSTLVDAIRYAADSRGALLVASGGNCGDESYYFNGCFYEDQPVYPAALSSVMAVASTDENDNQSSFSNQGDYIDIAAPGSNIYSTYQAGGYKEMSGTSMASPHVAGLAALIWSQDTSLTSSQVRTKIKSTAKDLGASGWDDKFGYGRINATAAVGLLQTTLAASDNSSPEEISTPATQAPFVPGEILFKPQPGLSANDVLDLAKNPEVKVTGQIVEIGVQKLAVPAGQEEAWLAELLQSGQMEYVELNYIITIQ